MKKICVLVLAAATAMVLAVGGGSAVAQDDVFNKNTCEAAGGTWTNLGNGQKQCVFPEETGKNDKFSCQETVSGGPGNLKPQKDTETAEDGTVDDKTTSGKCPPGQFSG